MRLRRRGELLESLVEAPVDPEMLARIDAARRERRVGIPHAEILKDSGFETISFWGTAARAWRGQLQDLP